MFVQVFHGKLSDPELWATQVEKWRRDIRPKTTGFLGFTTGTTADDYMITVVRFESEDKARVDSGLPEQDAWFQESSKAFAGEITFHDCPQVDLVFGGGSDKAGFVQIMQGRAKDPSEMRRLQKEFEAELRQVRPDLLGATIAWHDGGGFTQASYFTSEQEARANEQSMANSPSFKRFMSQLDGELTFYDLTEPAFA
jgi:hypothetical protein